MNKTGARVHRFFRGTSRKPAGTRGRESRIDSSMAFKVPRSRQRSQSGGRWGWSLEGIPWRIDPRSRCPFRTGQAMMVHDVRDRDKVMDRDENRAKSQNSTTSVRSIMGGAADLRVRSRAHRWWPKMVERFRKRQMRYAEVHGGLRPGLGEHPQESDCRTAVEVGLYFRVCSVSGRNPRFPRWRHLSVTQRPNWAVLRNQWFMVWYNSNAAFNVDWLLFMRVGYCLFACNTIV